MNLHLAALWVCTIITATSSTTTAFVQQPLPVSVSKKAAPTTTRQNQRQNQQRIVGGKQGPSTLPLSCLFASKSTNFPFSTRAALIEKAKEIDDNIEAKSGGSYSARGWSNRLGSVLTPVSIPGVYTADRPFYWNSIDVGCRMTIIELQDGKGSLWVHSPVELDGPLKQAIKEKLKGEVKYVVSPNYEHVKYAKQWYDTYSSNGAYMWGCPGLIERMPEINWAGEIPYNYVPGGSELNDDDKCWDVTNEIIPYHVDIELNPFTGKPFFNEVIFYHKPSKSLLTTDLYWNYPSNDGQTNSFLKNDGDEDGNEDLVLDWELAPSVDKIPFGSKAWKFGMDQIYLPFYKNLMIQKDDISKQKYEKLCHTLLEEWDIETIIPAHGDIIRGKELIRSILKNHLAL